MKSPSLLKILIIVIPISIVLVGFFAASQYYTSGPDFPSANKREFLPDQGSPKGEITISIDKTEYHHDKIIFEPVEFTVTNNTLSSIFFYTGCAVQFPYVFKGSSQDKMVASSPQPVCTLVPFVIELSPGSNEPFYWNQGSPLGGFLEGGTYRLGIEYSLNRVDRFKLGDMEMIYSRSFAIKEVIWDKIQQEEICRLYGQGINANDSYYSEENCVSWLNRL